MPKILLHSCCAPCGGQVINELKAQGFEVTVFFYNPNIFPIEEYEIRKNEIEKFCQSQNVEFIAEDYNHKKWLEFIKGLEKEPEGGPRCFKCYEFRLQETAKYAKENNFEYFASTLSISPHKNAEKINEIGREVVFSLLTGDVMPHLIFYEADWKKHDGFKKSCELSKTHNFYRQKYCGCEFSFHLSTL
ncbi:MAG TPA: epoxyqueuosine reductase QueH [bacterium]|nr:epoxyqueuosine reductase QueH [bacterium]